MPEELKPCPACGGTEIFIDALTGGYVQCCPCGVTGPFAATGEESVAAWNFMPRALTWTTVPPTAPGLYAVILYDEDQPRLHHHFAAPDAEDAKTVKYWLGPLPSPFGLKL